MTVTAEYITERYDSEYLNATEWMLPYLQGAPKAPILDVLAYREETELWLKSNFELLPMPEDVKYSVHHIKAPDGVQIDIYEFQKTTIPRSSPGPALLHCHGGGMVLGTVPINIKLIAADVSESSITIFSVDYRVAPENNNIGLVEDCFAGLRWVYENTVSLNIDPKRIGIMGESAGAGIAAGVALMARDQKLDPPLAKQILGSPMLDDRNNKLNEIINPYAVWKNHANIMGWTALLGDKAGDPDADVSYYAAPARAPSLAGLPSTFISVGNLDIFRDEDLEYAARIAKENIDTEFHLYPGVPHGFEDIAPQTKVAQQARANRMRAMRRF